MLKYNACAHARLGLRPFVPLDCKDHDPVFPVSPCCTRSVLHPVRAVQGGGAQELHFRPARSGPL